MELGELAEVLGALLGAVLLIACFGPAGLGLIVIFAALSWIAGSQVPADHRE